MEVRTNPQKSEVHVTTDDATTSPASNFETGAADKEIETAKRAPAEGGSEPSAKTNPDELYPDGVRVKRDESDVGGPIDVEVDTGE
jgi:hypothetical protein